MIFFFTFSFINLMLTSILFFAKKNYSTNISYSRNDYVCGQTIFKSYSCTPEKQIMTRIRGGHVAKINSIPWQAWVYIKYTPTFQFCGGTVISQYHILTAAHCLVNYSDPKFSLIKTRRLQVFVGVSSIVDKITADQSLEVKEYKIHENFSNTQLSFDIAIVRVNNSFIINDAVLPVCLPHLSTKTYVGTIGVVSGWGIISKSGALPRYLMRGDVQILSNDAKSCHPVTERPLHASKLCTDSSYFAPSNGDTGGPLTVRVGEECVVVGIVSFGEEKAEIYSSVPFMLDWIKNMSLQL